MTIERVRHSGALVISDFIHDSAGEYLFTRTYYGFSMRTAKQLFINECRMARGE